MSSSPAPQRGVPQHGGVFVYGTLMPGRANAAVAAAGGDFPASTPAWVDGFTLLDLRPEGYPALRPGGSGAGGRVHGFLLRYPADHWPRALPLLDELEGVEETPPLYTRELVSVTPQQGEPLRAWIYLYADAARLERPGCTPVPSGRWTAQGEASHGAAEGPGLDAGRTLP